MSAALLLFRREFGLAWGRGGGAILALAFYASITALTPLAAGFTTRNRKGPRNGAPKTF